MGEISVGSSGAVGWGRDKAIAAARGTGPREYEQSKGGRTPTRAVLVNEGTRHRTTAVRAVTLASSLASPRYTSSAKTTFHDEPRKMGHAPASHSWTSACLSTCPFVGPSVRPSVRLSVCVCLSVCLRTHNGATPTCHTLVRPVSCPFLKLSGVFCGLEVVQLWDKINWTG